MAEEKSTTSSNSIMDSIAPLVAEIEKLTKRLDDSKQRQQTDSGISFDTYAEPTSILREREAARDLPMGFAPQGASKGGIAFAGGSPFPVQKGPQMTRALTGALVNILSTIGEIQQAKKRREQESKPKE